MKMLFNLFFFKWLVINKWKYKGKFWRTKQNKTKRGAGFECNKAKLVIIC